MRLLFILFCTFLTFSIISSPVMAKKTYEDYMHLRKKGQYRDRPLSEIRTGDKDDVMDELRGAIRDEIDSSMNKERKASKEKIDENKFIRDVRKIVKEEIEDAIKIKEKNYLSAGSFEIGGFLSYTSKGIESDENDNNTIMKIFPMVNYFIHDNIGIMIKGEADLNLTQSSQSYNVVLGPQYVFGIDRMDEICFYSSLFIGISYNSALSDSFGYRYGNELGMKFILTSGVILNFGVMIIFDNAGDNVTGFQNVFEPTIGISAWF